jgi:hypothetical protein
MAGDYGVVSVNRESKGIGKKHIFVRGLLMLLVICHWVMITPCSGAFKRWYWIASCDMFKREVPFTYKRAPFCNTAQKPKS